MKATVSKKSHNQQDLVSSTIEKALSLVAADEAAQFQLCSGGAKTRAKICLHAGLALQVSEHDTVCAATAIELLHNASLAHDDIQDGDEMRRSRPSVWRQYGKARAICAGDSLINAAYAAIGQIEDPTMCRDVLTLTNQAVAETINGQNQDLDQRQAISVEQYEQIAAQKSGPLLRLSLALPAVLAGRFDLLEKIHYIAERFSIAYQIYDDTADWQHDKARQAPNFVCLNAALGNESESLFIARQRVKYLLKLCQKALAALPNNCAYQAIQVASQMLHALEQHSAEELSH